MLTEGRKHGGSLEPGSAPDRSGSPYVHATDEDLKQGRQPLQPANEKGPDQ